MTRLAAATGPQATWGEKTPVRHRPKTLIRPFRKNAGPNENRLEKRRLQNVKKIRLLLASHPTPPLRASSPARRKKAIRGAAWREGADAGDLKVSRPAPLAGPWARRLTHRIPRKMLPEPRRTTWTISLTGTSPRGRN